MIEGSGGDPSYTPLQTALYTLLAAVAGGLGYITRSMQHGLRPGLMRTLVEAGSAGFVGVMTLWACEATGMPQNWTGVTVGVLGWLGSSASIQLLEKLVYKNIGLPPRPTDPGAGGTHSQGGQGSSTP